MAMWEGTDHLPDSSKMTDAADSGGGRQMQHMLFKASLGLLAGCSILAVVIWALILHMNVTDPQGQHFETDYSVFWGAAKLALAGEWASAFDPETLNTARSLPDAPARGSLPWLYPPSFQLMLAPFGHLPLFWSWLAFVTVSFGCLASALIPVTRGINGGLVFFLCAPICLLLVVLGQSSLLIFALLLLGLESIRRGNPVLAGAAFALMTIKPQLGLAIPVALMAAGYWRVIGWGAIWTAVLVLVSISVAGTAPWVAFWSTLSSGFDPSGPPPAVMMVSVQGVARALGLPFFYSNVIQAGVACLVAWHLARLWAERTVSFDHKAAALCFATVLMTPYALFYELIMMLGGFFYLVRAGFGALAWQRLVLIIAWIGPGLCWWLIPHPTFGSMLLLTAVGFTLALVRGGRHVRS